MSKKVPTSVTFTVEYINADGEEDIRELTMKSAKLIPRKILRMSPSEVVDAALRWAMSEEDYAWSDEIPGTDVNDHGGVITNAWNKASEITVGESSAS